MINFTKRHIDKFIPKYTFATLPQFDVRKDYYSILGVLIIILINYRLIEVLLMNKLSLNIMN